MSKSIVIRKLREKKLVIEQLTKTPIVQIACEKSGIGRATYYRWRKEDNQFAKEADKAITNGSLLINDLAESQLMSAIRDRNMTAIIFWLKHHHAKYTTRVELTTQLKKYDEELTPEQEKLVTKALQIAALTSTQSIKEVDSGGKS